MTIVRVSSRYLVTIPKAVRGRLGIKPGQRVSVTQRDGRLIVTPIPEDPIGYLCGLYEDGPSMTQELLEERARDLEHE